MKFDKPNLDSDRHNVGEAAKIFDRYGDFIRKVIDSHVQNKDQAEDIFQNFFLSLVNNPLSGDIQNVESYLYRMITHDIADAVRRTKKYQNCIYEFGKCKHHPPNQKTPEIFYLEEEEANRLLELIEELLPRTEAQAVRSQYRDGLSAQEIAKNMSVCSSTVRGYVSQGLSRIRGFIRNIRVNAAD